MSESSQMLENKAQPWPALQRPGGIRLATTRWAGRRRPVVFAHGFGQTRQAWTATAQALADAGFACLSFDARGHGESAWRDAEPYRFEEMGEDLHAAGVAAAVAGTAPVLVGASMGGLLGLAAQHRYPGTFSALVLVDVTPRWESGGVERILGFMRAHPDGFASLQDAAAAIAAYLPHRDAVKSPDRLRSLLIERSDGRLRWHWDPRLIDDVAVGSERYQPMLAAAAASVDVPMLLISGGESDLVSRATIDEFLTLAPHARHVVVPKATHMVAGDDNAAFTAHVLTFLESLDSEELQ